MRSQGTGRGSWTVPPYSPEDFRSSRKTSKTHAPMHVSTTLVPETTSSPVVPDTLSVPDPIPHVHEEHHQLPTANLTISELFSAAKLPSDPTAFQEAMSRPEKEQWLAAGRAEFNSLIKNKTWKLEDCPQGRKAIEGKW